MIYTKRHWLILSMAMVLMTLPYMARAQFSPNYEMKIDLISQGEGDGISPGYELFSIIGQPLGGGLSSSTHYRNYQGLMYALMGPPEQLEAIVLQSPDNGAVFGTCSLITNYQPFFLWTSAEPFTKYALLFSTSSESFTAPIAKASVQGSQNSWTPSATIWKKIMTSSHNNGTIQDIYWKVTGATSTKTTEESEVWSFRVGGSQAVTIKSPVDDSTLSSGTTPLFEFSTNCNIKFRLEISPLSDFGDSSKIKGANYSVKDPNVDMTLSTTVSSSLWAAVKKLVGTGTGYFRIKAWDGLNRMIVSEVESFTIK